MKHNTEKLIARKKLIKKIKPNVSYAGILDIIQVIMVLLIVLKMYGLDAKIIALLLPY